MQGLVAQPTASRRVGRMLLGGAASAVLLSTLVVAGALLTDQEERFPNFVSYLEIDDDYLAYATIFAASDTHVIYWNSEDDQKPDRVLLTRGEDIDRLLAGEAPESIIQEFRATEHGEVVFQPPTTLCDLPQGGCRESFPIILFLRGDAWVGHDRSEIHHDEIEPYLGDGVAVPWPAPIDFGGGSVHTSTLRMIPLWYATWAIGAIASVVGAYLMFRATTTQREREPLPRAPTAEMLGLVRVIDLHARSVERSLWTSALLIPAIGALAIYVTFDAWVSAATGHWIEVPYPASLWLLILAIPFTTLVAGVFLVAHWREVRAELSTWRELRARLEAESRAILEG